MESNIKDVEKDILNISKQIDYAASLALNNTSEKAMRESVKHNKDAFDNNYKSWNKVGVAIKKKSATKENLEVQIYIPHTWLVDHEKGNIRSGMQLIPTKEFRNMYPGIKSNKAIKEKAKQLLSNKKKYRIFDTRINGNRYVMQAGILGDLKTGRNKYYKRKVAGARKKKVQNRSAVPLFLVKQSVKEKSILEFESTIRKTFEKDFNKNFIKAFRYAIKTAK